MKKVWGYFCIVTMTAYVTTAWGYEIGTHEKLSTAAAEASQLKKDPELLKNLGVTLTDKFKNTDGADRNIPELIGDGARFEDDTNGVKRPLNHFYNPLNNLPLTSGGLSYNTSPDWALEDNGDLYFQHNSYKDARAYFFAALTGSALTDRQKTFGLTFQTLGMVIHHIQDMAQPQHVRNDAHCDVGIFGCGIFFYNPSLYEKYSDKQRAKGALPFTGYSPTYSSTDTATFNSPRKFWHTTDGKGMADFTNRGFVSAGTIFDIAFPSPVLDLSKKLDFDIKDLVPGTSLKGNVRFYGNTVTDNYTGVSVNNPMAVTRSIFDAELEKYATFGKKAVYTLNSFNFDAAHSFLIPRAVGYSAGLINYFFRGKMDMSADPNSPGQYLLQNLGTEPMSGDFALYYDAVDGKRYPATGSAWPQTSIQAGGQQTVSLGLPGANDPEPKTPGEYMLAFRGSLGQEQPVNGSVGAVAGKLVYDPFFVHVKNYSLAFGESVGPVLYSVWTYIEKNPTLGDAIDRFGDSMILTFDGQAIPCTRWAYASLYCDNGDPHHTGITIDAMGTTSWDGPYFDVNHSLIPSGKVTLSLGNAILFSFEFASVGAIELRALSFTNAFHFNTKNAVLGLF